MGTLILINDVSTEIEESSLLVGDLDPSASALGNSQVDIIVPNLFSKINKIDVIFSSDAKRVLKLTHRIRLLSSDNSLGSLDVRKLKSLRERSFGILNRSPIGLSGDMFGQYHILAEDGESVFQCKNRLMKCIKRLCNEYKDKSILIVSHPFSCQILSNVILNRGHNLITEFWQNKGACMIIGFNQGKYGIKWSLANAFNTIANTTYTKDEIYSSILG